MNHHFVHVSYALDDLSTSTEIKIQPLFDANLSSVKNDVGMRR